MYNLNVELKEVGAELMSIYIISRKMILPSPPAPDRSTRPRNSAYILK
jgi:hypothetical protein